MPASEAKSAGLVNEVFQNQDELLEKVMTIAEELASKAPLAVYGSKRMINYSRDHSTADALDYVRTWNASMLHRDEIAEAMESSKENRPGDFADLPPIPKSSGSI